MRREMVSWSMLNGFRIVSSVIIVLVRYSVRYGFVLPMYPPVRRPAPLSTKTESSRGLPPRHTLLW